jgi:hypothetical protein
MSRESLAICGLVSGLPSLSLDFVGAEGQLRSVNPSTGLVDGDTTRCRQTPVGHVEDCGCVSCHPV